MRTIIEAVSGGVIDEDVTIIGQVQGDASIATGTTVVLVGQVAGSLTVDAGATATVMGQVAGSIVNRGTLFVKGMVVGTLTDVDGGSSAIDAGTFVNGRQH